METKRYLVMTFRKPGFDGGLVAPHLAFLEQLRAQGKLEMTGGFSDKSGGAYLLRVGDLEEARAIADADPLNARNGSTITVYEWNTRA